MNEATITRQVMENWKRQRSDLWCWKVPDYMRPGTNYSNDRAVDVIACFDGVCVGIEWKIKKDDRAFPIKKIREGQIKTLCDIEVAGGVGLIAIAVYKGPKDKCVYLIPISCWNQAVKATTDRKSIRIEETFPNLRIEPQRAGQYVHWNLRLLWEFVCEAKRKIRRR